MSTNATSGEESTDTLDQRDVCALTECMSVLGHIGRAKDADGLYIVVSQSGTEYLVDVLGEACECPDHGYNDNHCKHLRGVEFATGRRMIPEWVQEDAINNTLGSHVDEEPVFAASIDPEPDAFAEFESKPHVATDGGVAVPRGTDTDTEMPVISTEDGGARLVLHDLAMDHTALDELPDFKPYCAAVEFATDALETAINRDDY